MKKKILIISLVVAVLAVAVIGGTLAWFTDQETATNTFTVGDVEISLREPAWNGIAFGSEWDDLTWNEVTDQELGVVKAHNFVPSRVIPKDPTVKVEGTNPCYLRVKVTIPDVSYDATDLAELDSMFTTVNTSWFDTDWAQDGDNYIKYFYYGSNSGETTYTILNPGETLYKVFDSITIPSSFTEADFVEGTRDFVITVTAEAIQSEGVDSANPWTNF